MAAMKQWATGAWMMAGLTACSAQVEPDYRGEPLATIRGALVTGEQAAPSEVDAALVWVSGAADDEGWPIARVHVRGEFPAQFSIEVFDAPPVLTIPVQQGDELVQMPDPTAIGVLAAIAPNSGDRVSYDEILGVWLDGGVEYFQRGANGEPSDFVQSEAERRKIPATQGYHLFRQTSDTQIEGNAFRCQYRDLCTHDVDTGAPGADLPDRSGWTRYDTDLQVLRDADYAKCQQYLDHPATCTSYYPEAVTAEQQAENARCQELHAAWFERLSATPDEGCSPVPWQYVENPDGFSSPVSIQFGTTWLEWLNPRYRP
jgi:hypothetical protein